MILKIKKTNSCYYSKNPQPESEFCNPIPHVRDCNLQSHVIIQKIRSPNPNSVIRILQSEFCNLMLLFKKSAARIRIPQSDPARAGLQSAI